MIISYRHKFIFIKGRKVAGTSLEAVLSSICGPDDIITPITPIDEQRRMNDYFAHLQNYGADEVKLANYIALLPSLSSNGFKGVKPPKGIYQRHMSLRDVIDKFGSIPEDWRVFAIERCPYRKVISRANMDLEFQDYIKSGTSMVSDVNVLKEQITQVIESGRLTTVKNIDLYRNDKDIINVELLKCENIEYDLAKMMSLLGVSDYPSLPRFKAGVSSNNYPLDVIFSPKQLRQVNTFLYEEFKQFGYEMLSC